MNKQVKCLQIELLKRLSPSQASSTIGKVLLVKAGLLEDVRDIVDTPLLRKDEKVLQ